MSRPFFSVLVTVYNRSGQIARCVSSCAAQTFEDLEIVVVDDGSTDDTLAVLDGLGEPRLRVVRHSSNRGISPARATAAAHATGTWLVMLDSDWELEPDALARLKAIIDGLPPDVRIIRSRLRADDGSLEPGVMPHGVTDYVGRLRWCDAVAAAGAASDAGHCVHRSVLDADPLIDDRRGAVETLWELDVARRQPSLWVSDVLGLQHTDAPNSHLRDLRASRLVPRLLAEAPDVLWMNQTLLAEHREGLARYAPTYRLALEESAALEGFLAGDRRAGIRNSVTALRHGGPPARILATAATGILGPRSLAYAKVAGRRWRARRNG
ncbi:MAG: glycosyltransferase [Solirubrobacteraceae bacterium]